MQPDEVSRLLKYLNDALSAAEEIEINTIGLSERNYYFNNIKWIVERGIEIISAALKRANLIDPTLNLAITNQSKIFATRNKIAHEYDVVDPLQLYNIVVKNIPILIGELKTIIEKLEKENG
ncbi:MAG: DUF86 domain-containing protein [Bacteroidota bacterium]|nr:DUF86 domain-containing protein [Bacteroidota bacterium]